MRGVARRTWQVARQLSREHLLEHVLPLTKRLAQALVEPRDYIRKCGSKVKLLTWHCHAQIKEGLETS